jgi:integrase
VNTAASVEVILRRHILPTFGTRRLSTIRTSEVQAWVSGLDLAPSTVSVVYSKFAAIMRAAVEDRLIPSSPCTRRMKLPRPPGGEVVPMTPEQVLAVVDAAPDRYRAVLILLTGTGVRNGEALGLTIDRVDFLRRQIRIDRQLATVSGEPPAFAPCKTEASVRTIPAPDLVLEELARHLDRFGTGPDGLVFTDSKGDPIRRNAFGHVWRRAAKSAGRDRVQPEGPKALRRIGPHRPWGLREGRTAATRTRQRIDHPRHVCPPLARVGGP